MAEVTFVVCDMCGGMDRHTHRYWIGKGKDTTTFDLCEEHAAPVEAVLGTKGPVPPTPPPGSAAPAWDELAARKATRTLPARKPSQN